MTPAIRGSPRRCSQATAGLMHRANYDGDKQDENDLVKPIEQPEAKGDKNEDESRPRDPPKCPVIRLRRWIECHAFPNSFGLPGDEPDRKTARVKPNSLPAQQDQNTCSEGEDTHDQR